MEIYVRLGQGSPVQRETCRGSRAGEGRRGLSEKNAKNRLAAQRFPLAKVDMQVKRIYKTPGSWPDCVCAQNGLTTTRSTIAISAKVGSSLTVRKNRGEWVLALPAKA